MSKKNGHHENAATADDQLHSTASLPRMTSDLYRVGGGYSVRFSTAQGFLHCEWHPHMPSPRDFRRKVDERRYEAARDAFVLELAGRMGGSALVIGVEGAR